jgi:hypothetical protein
MSLMAFLTVSCTHIGSVGLVTLDAFRDLSVDTVTGVAIESGMLALVLFELGDLLGMAG